MKFSQFNSIISLSDKYSLIYNAYSGRYLILPSVLTLLNDIDHIKKNQKELYKKLLDSGCIINESIDELEQVKQLQFEVDNNNQGFVLTINPTLDCNFSCWYCYENHIVKSKVEKETLCNMKKFISNTIITQAGLKTFNLNFFGGEPLLQYETVKDIIRYTKSQCEVKKINLSVSFTTNGYLLNKKKVEEFSEYGVNSMQITLDGSRELHNKVRFASQKIGSYDKIINNIKLLLEKKIQVVLRINYTAENIESVSDIVNDLSDIKDEFKSYLLVQFFRVWQDSQGEDIKSVVDATIKAFRDENFKAYTYPLNNVRSSCYGDKTNGALINYNGDIYRCTAVNFSAEKRDGYLDCDGHIVWEEDSFNRRKYAKFKNKPCLECRLLPICNGGCSQHALRHEGEDYCIFNFDEKKKDESVLSKLDILL